MTNAVDLNSRRNTDAHIRARQRQNARLRNERRRRLRLTKGRENVLAEMDPAVTTALTSAEVCDYFGISRSTLIAITRAHGEELASAGYEAGGPTGTAVFSPRSLLHIALLTRTSRRGRAIRQALGVESEKTITPSPQRGSAVHIRACKALLGRAIEIAADVRDIDPNDIWSELDKLDRWQLQGIIIALAALVPVDQPGLRRYLTELGRSTGTHQREESADARGLSLLVPPRRSLKVAE